MGSEREVDSCRATHRHRFWRRVLREYVQVADEKGRTAVGFLRRAVPHYGSYGIQVERVMTDNGHAYRSTVHALGCRALGLRHLRTRPYRPRTNGKAERFIRTLLTGWVYGAIYRNSD